MATKKKPTWKVPLTVPYVLPPNPTDNQKWWYNRMTSSFPVGSLYDGYYSGKDGVEEVEPFEFHATLRYVERRHGRHGCTGVVLQDVQGARFPISTSDWFDILIDRGCGPDMQVSGLWGFKKHGSSVTIKALDLKS